MVEYSRKDRLNVPSLGDVSFCGAIEEKLQRVIYQRMTSDAAQNEVFAEAENAFVTQVDDENAPIGIWQGEFWGKLMVSACRGAKYTGDEKLKEFLRKSVYKIMACQREDGYIGTYKNDKQVFVADLEEGRRIMGWDCTWTWNIWCRKYTLWGMLEAYELLGDEEILESAARSANQLIDMLEEMGARICETGTFYGVASGSILKPILVLYRHTGNKKYLDFALEIAKEWEDSDTACLKLIKLAIDGVPVTLWGHTAADMEPASEYNPLAGEGKPVFEPKDRGNAECAGKVYEMQSCFDGLLELYRVTGTKKYLTATEMFFENIVKYEYNTLFSVGFNDLFIGGAHNPNSITEHCDVLHFIRLATELYKLTGEVRYIDFVELAFYNPFLAGVARDGSWAARGVRAAEGHMYARLQAGFTKNHCCTNNMPRGFMNVAETIALSDENGVYINLYGEAKATIHPTSLETVEISIGDGYLDRCAVSIEIDATLTDTKSLMLRIPQWSIETEIICGGKTYTPVAGEYFELKFNSGKTVVDIKFDNSPRLIEKKYNFEFYPFTPYMAKRYFSDDGTHEDTVIHSNRATLCVGPVLLAVSKDLGSTKEEMFNHPTVFDKECECTVTPINAPGFMCAYDVTFKGKDGFELRLPMGDFASASDEDKHVDYRYTVFI